MFSVKKGRLYGLNNGVIETYRDLHQRAPESVEPSEDIQTETNASSDYSKGRTS
jgi:hypothetical protein